MYIHTSIHTYGWLAGWNGALLNSAAHSAMSTGSDHHAMRAPNFVQ